ncbi:tyrosine-protein phosphatase [Actinoplanes sp. TBRC 11911]|uniref:tyrosine-protein phosphatase n=1 Tax=Actinoplanes sp. TBRC 11911 TaxID=2729386 RepID=UPI00145E7A01|nr:tyrosine-protein phosphatase [Actinoplanes sp. TBRC 11911]NMO56116.1 tyrosine-protein phosphatase [Actinoplanes sp. TBRC 11911]
MAERHLEWAGCRNVRDLGGLPLTGGGATRWRSVVRADSLDRLTPAGWNSLSAYGVRTVVDLREDDERSPDIARPAGITVVHAPVDDNADTAFWYRVTDDDIDGTPLYYRPFLERKADRCAAAVRAVARAGAGAVVIHCGIGRDRTGLIALLLLALAGVTPAAIIEDYALSGERLRRHFERDDDPVAERLAARGTTIAAALHALLSEVDVAACLRDAGLTPADVGAVRDRMIVDNFGHGPR